MHLNKEEARFISKWAKIRERSQWHYILTRGFLWGLGVGAISHLFKVWDLLMAWDTVALVDTYTSTDFFTRLFIYSAIGCGIHAYYWNFNKKRYKQLKNIERRSQTMATSAKD